MTSGFLCSLHAQFEKISFIKLGRKKNKRKKNADIESLFFQVARDRFKHCSCKKKDSKIPFGTWMGEQGYRNKEGLY